MDLQKAAKPPCYGSYLVVPLELLFAPRRIGVARLPAQWARPAVELEVEPARRAPEPDLALLPAVHAVVSGVQRADQPGLGHPEGHHLLTQRTWIVRTGTHTIIIST